MRCCNNNNGEKATKKWQKRLVWCTATTNKTNIAGTGFVVLFEVVQSSMKGKCVDGSLVTFPDDVVWGVEYQIRKRVTQPL